jgi:hypothetical protein
LSARGVPTRIGSRSGEPPFDRDDQTTWGPAPQNMESAYIVYYPDLAVPGARAAIRFFDDQAVQSGVRRLVLLSGRCEEEALLSEQTLKDWTILRSSWFCQNFSEDFLIEGERSIDMFLQLCGDLPMSEEETTRKAVGRRPEHLSVFECFRRWSEAARAAYKSPRTRCAEIFGIEIRSSSAVRKLEKNEESLRLCVLVRQRIML